MDFKNCLGMMASVSTLLRSSGATMAVILVKAFMFCTFSFVEDYKMPRFPGHLRLNFV
jgi:hypothetical protein